MRWIANAVVDAAVIVSEQHAAFAIHRDFVEIEQVAVRVTAAALPDAAQSLDRVVRRGVDYAPVIAAVIGRGDVEIPETRKGYSLIKTWPVSAKKTDCGTAVVTGDCFGEYSIDDPMRYAQV